PGTTNWQPAMDSERQSPAKRIRPFSHRSTAEVDRSAAVAMLGGDEAESSMAGAAGGGGGVVLLPARGARGAAGAGPLSPGGPGGAGRGGGAALPARGRRHGGVRRDAALSVGSTGGRVPGA